MCKYVFFVVVAFLQLVRIKCIIASDCSDTWHIFFITEMLAFRRKYIYVFLCITHTQKKGSKKGEILNVNFGKM